MEKVHIKTVIIDEKSREDTITYNLLNWLNIHNKNISPIYVKDARKWINDNKQSYSFYDKNIIILHPFEGKFLSSCPGSDGVICCNYFVLNTGINCPFDCSYCYLQTFNNHPFITVHTNINQMFHEITAFLKDKNNFHFRIGTGEYSDSIVLDNITGMNKELIQFFNKTSNATLELKTKSASIDHLLNLNHRNIVLSWSLNPPGIIEMHEKNASSLEDRISAAQKAASKGFQVAFHFDPIILHDKWQEHYGKVIENLRDQIPVEMIRWISIGMFRHSSGLKELLKINKPKNNLTMAELIKGSDQKYRYLSSLRVNVYRYMKDKIDKELKGVFVYLCMETMNVWKRSCGFSPSNPLALNEGFEKRRLSIEEYGIH